MTDPSPAKPSSARRKKRSWWTILRHLSTAITLATTLVPPAFYLYSRYQLSSAISKYRAAGNPITAQDFSRYDLTPSENAATGLMPFLKRAEDITKLEDALLSVALSDRPPDPEDLPAISGILDRYLSPEPDLAKALSLPRVRWPATRPGSVADPEPHLAGIRTLANLLAADARLASRRGDPGHAKQRITQLLKLSRLAGQDGPVVGMLVSSGVKAQTAAVISEEPSVVLTKEATIQLIHLLMQDAVEDAMWIDAFHTETAKLIEFHRSTVQPQSLPYFNPAIILMTRGAAIAIPLSELRVKALLSTTSSEQRKAISDQIKSTTSTKLNTLAGLFVAGHDSLIRTRLQIRTDSALAALSLALRSYQKDHGELPSNLNLLTPTYFDTVPLDPFASPPAPIQYDSQRALLWSVGSDSINNHGSTAIPAAQKRRWSNTDNLPGPWDFEDRTQNLNPSAHLPQKPLRLQVELDQP